jgi:hypothetical protein
VLRNIGQGIGILVSKFPKETAASYSLREPAEVRTIHAPGAIYFEPCTVDQKANITNPKATAHLVATPTHQ